MRVVDEGNVASGVLGPVGPALPGSSDAGKLWSVSDDDDEREMPLDVGK